TLFRDADAQGTSGYSLSPAYFNLADVSSISSTATCGQDENGTPRHELYCKLVGGLTYGLPSQIYRPPVTNAIDGTERWWQSPPLSMGQGYNEVNVTLDLKQLFHVAYILLKFANSPRPDLWVLERSVDNGRTFTPWQYFAHSKRECIEKFGKQPNARIVHDDDQICTTEYSRINPLENGEIVVSLVNGRPGSKNFTYSPVLRDFTKATNIRLRFLRTSTLLGHLISKAQRDPTVTRRVRNKLYDLTQSITIVSKTSASVDDAFAMGIHRLQCECQHNTCGQSCDRCCPGFHQKPWRVATVDSPNECRPCQCFSHATDCYYDPEVEKKGASLDTFGRYDGGGVCINCQHNTAGMNCEQCLEGFYRPFGVPPESPTGCIRVMRGLQPAVKWGQEGVSASHNWLERTVIAVLTDTITTLNVFHILYTRRPPNPLPDLLWSVYVTTEGPCMGYATIQDAACAVRVWRGSDVTAANQDTTPSQTASVRRIPFPMSISVTSCACEGAGVTGRMCSPSGQCICFPNYAGNECDECAPGYYGYPDCAVYATPCRVSVCVSQGWWASSVTAVPQDSGSPSAQGFCRCLPSVEGTLCDSCKPLYWNLASEPSRGCIECRCDVKGTLSGVGECEQKNGQCHCKPNACGLECETCKDGFYLLQKKNYVGCQGCQCDVGGAIGTACDDISGQCWCRKNVVGRQCTEPAPSYYFPSLHQLKFEVEDGTTPNARPVRFGFNPKEFPDFSWRGYAVMSPAQSEVRVTVHVDPKDEKQHLYRVVLRFTNPNGTSVTGSIKATNNRGTQGSDQSKEVIFPESPSPSFLTVPGEGFAEPFAMTPGTWTIHIRAEGVLLDYLVLLPRDFYEAPLLQEKITQPCTYLLPAHKDTNCLLYKHVSMDGFSSALGSQGFLSSRSGRRRRQARVRRPTPAHPEMAALNGRLSQLQLSLRVPRPGPYALVLEYASEVDTVQNVNILISGESGGQIPARANIYSCAYSFLCRSVAVDSSNKVTVLQLDHKTEVLLQTSTTSFLLYKVYAVPIEDFSLEYVEPKVLCVSTHGYFTEDSRDCVLRQFDKPASALILYAATDGQLSSAPAVSPQQGENEDWRRRRQTGVFPVCEPNSDGILLKFPQTEISFTPNVPLPGRYVVVVHYHQPEHTSFPVEVQVNAGREWKGSINASFCPAVSGCRAVVIADGRIALDFERNSWQQPTISVIVPPKKTLTLDYIMLVPDSSYTPDLLKEKPLNKSADFIQQCRGEGFYIDPNTSPQFCRDSARSLVAAFNDGALPCNCDKSGSTGTTCEPIGGQCPCRQHVIGRQCTKCATGYYGFPYCRPCECGRRLCDEVTGICICPPQTVKPSCDVCQSQTFSYHPLLGCEGCECSPNGIQANAGPDCDRTTGQCSCKPRIAGRQCDRCAAGYYRFPDCVPCNCKEDGVTADICHPDTGRCLCKRNVAGVKCETCREGSFYFDPSNPHGCTSCFCFGATDQCQSSSKRRGKFVGMRGWRLESPDQEEVTSVLNTASNTVVSSYGGFLTYQSKSFGIPSEGMTLMDRRPDVVLTGQDMTLIHMAQQVPLPDKPYQGRVQLLEGNWRHAVSSRPVSREELMTVLAALAGLRIRALYFTQTQRLSLGEVGLEGATETGTGGPGNTVEDCSCPSEYTGDSCQTLLCWTLIGLCCAGHRPRERGERTRYARHHERWTQRIEFPSLNDQGTQRIEFPSLNDQGTQRIEYPSLNDEGTQGVQGRGQAVLFPNVNDGSANYEIEKCAPGYYREGSGYFLGRCVRCECNGLADECQDKTGRCRNCQYNTAGDRCERCKEGYYGNAALRTCKMCPCPSSMNSFAIGCKEVFGGLECICRVGYSGDKCESCAPGYYGAPLTIGGSCRPCICNGNNCDSRTGVCKNTLEPKDTNTDEPCQECDNCAQTLLNDLEKLDDEIGRIKTQLDNASASSSSQDRLKKLEKLVADTKIIVNNFNSAITNQKPKVNQLEDDESTLSDDIDSLRDKADKRAADADKAVADVDKTNKRAKDLDAEIQNMLKKIQALLDQLKDTGTSGDKPPNEDLSQMLKDAQRMVKEMQDRNFTPQKTAAEKEKDAAKKLLENIKTNVSKQCDQNEVAAEKLRDDLKGFGAKLKDLDKALKEAVDLLKKTNFQNGLNAQALTDLKKRINDIQTERETVKDQMILAENELQKTEDLVEMLYDSKTEYEQLAAQLDGAKTDLNKKVNDITKAAAKEDLVVRAEDHAKNLAKTAKELEDTVKSASGLTEVRDAKDAIDAYKNITDAINAAETAAKEAKSAADNALNNVKKENLKERAKDLKQNGEELLNDGKAAETDLQGVKEDITELKKRLAKADTKKKTLVKDLLDAQNQLNGIKRDDIGQMIDEAKRKAALANDTASKTMDTLNDIKEEMKKISVTPVDSNLGSVLDDVSKSVNDLLKTIPSLNDKISEVEDLTSQFSPISNISENIKYIKNLIELARDAANRNYIGMVLKNNQLYGVYKLNGVTHQIETDFITTSTSEPAKFDQFFPHIYSIPFYVVFKVNHYKIPRKFVKMVNVDICTLFRI
ncbi:hypothetical protein F7725_011427, partial [Dissostichus mawsoni]